MLLAGDIGGTNTRLGLFDGGPERPRRIARRVFTTLEYPDLAGIVADFAKDQAMNGAAVDAASFGVAGPVVGQTAELTNVPWRVDARQISEALGIGRVRLLNDLEALAHAIPVLEPSELFVLQPGKASAAGNLALIAAGTGLGESTLHKVDGRFVPIASEGGHADFAARTESEIDLLRDLVRRYGHAEVEHVISGMGLLNLHRIAHTDPCLALDNLDAPEAAAVISGAALARSCPGCVDTLNMFVEAYGAEAGNLALRSTAIGGVFVGGGIAPKILPVLTDGRFIGAFRAKAPQFRAMLESIPVKVILNDEAGLLGAAVHARNR
jgi:glucokinase